MRRSLGFVPFLALSALLAACQEEGGELTSAPAAASASTIEAACAEAPEICELIEGLFPAPKPGKGLESAAYTRFGNIARQRDQGEIADAVAKTFELIVFVFEKDLDDPNGGAPPTTDEGRIQLANLLLEFVGLPAIFPVGDGDFAWRICEPGVKCVFETENEFAGFSGTFTELTLVTISRLPDNTFESVGVTGFPLIFDFSAASASDAQSGPSAGLALAALAEPATVAVCVVDPPDPAAPDEDELANLALGHIIQGSEGDSVEILPDAPPGDFALDCEGASSEPPPPVEIVSLEWWGERAASAFEPVSDFLVSPLLANPGERRGLITAFSPVGGIDTRTVGDGEEGGPTMTTLLLNEQPVGLSIVHGQIATATAIVAPSPANGLEPVVNFIISLGLNQQIIPAFLDDGEASITIQCDALDEIASEADAEVGPFTYFVQAQFPGAGDFESSQSAFLTLGCSAPIG
ncbi:MAG: hypothetical protein ACRD3V_32550 [Vicinamibacteria bacterium]